MATALTSLANVKDWLQITNTASDVVLARMIAAFSDAVANELNRDISLQAYTIVRDGNGSTDMVFTSYPVTSVTSLKVDGTNIPSRPAFGSNGYVFTSTRISLVGYTFTRGRQNVELSTMAGYALIPTSIIQFYEVL